MIRRWNRWAARFPHMHFFLWEEVQERTGEDLIVIPAPYALDRLMLRYTKHGAVWRFTFDS
jgi:hypothetical protein